MNATDINPETGKAYAINPASGVWDDNYFASLNKGSGGGGGTESYDKLLSDLPSASAFADTVSAPENQAFGDYMNYLSNQQSPLDFYTKMSEQAGIPKMRETEKTLQGQIYSLEDSLRRVEPDVAATSRNSIMTEAQRRGQVQERQEPLLENLGWLSQSYGRVVGARNELEGLIMNLTGLNEQGIARMSDAFKTQIALRSDQAARKMTGFTTDLQNRLSISLAKIARNEAIDDREKAEAFELLKLSKQYEAEAAAEAKKLISVGEGTSLYDPATGQVVFKADKTYKGDGDGGVDIDSDYYNDDSGGDYELLNFTNLLDYNKWLSQQRGYQM